MHTLLYLKWTTNTNLHYSTANLLHISWQPEWEGTLGRMDTCMCVAESPPCSPETVTTLLISYTLIKKEV